MSQVKGNAVRVAVVLESPSGQTSCLSVILNTLHAYTTWPIASEDDRAGTAGGSAQLLQPGGCDDIAWTIKKANRDHHAATRFRRVSGRPPREAMTEVPICCNSDET